MNHNKKSLKPWLLLWGTQSLSALGSAMTSFALVIWLYQRSGSALQTALLSICSYAPYVVMSIFAGALSDRWNKKKTMLVCDLIAALTTVLVYVLIRSDTLAPWHLYLLNALNGLMNTVQQPASEVAATLLIPEGSYQRTSGLRSLSNSLNSILTPIIASAVYALWGMEFVIAIDLSTFCIAFLVLWLKISIPETEKKKIQGEPILLSARKGLKWLHENPLILRLILFLAAINLVASAYNAALPAMLLSRKNGGETVLGLVNSCAGIATLIGSLVVTLLPAPKNRINVICMALFLSMSTENFMLAFGKTPYVWCAGAILGWIAIPLMNANMDVIFRRTIPTDMQGRVYSCRNTLQFFTIPVGFFLGGFLVDHVFEPLMERQNESGLLTFLFGTGKGSGAAFLFALLGVTGVAVCVVFRILLSPYHWREDVFGAVER